MEPEVLSALQIDDDALPVGSSEAARALGRLGGAAMRARAAQGRKPKQTPQEYINTWATKWALWKPVRGDPREYIEKQWTKKIPRVYEGLIKEAAAGNPIPPLVVELLKAMTLMCSLSPERLKQKIAEDDPTLQLPGNLDMSQVDSETLMKIAGRQQQTPALPAPKRTKTRTRPSVRKNKA